MFVTGLLRCLSFIWVLLCEIFVYVIVQFQRGRVRISLVLNWSY